MTTVSPGPRTLRVARASFISTPPVMKCVVRPSPSGVIWGESGRAAQLRPIRARQTNEGVPGWNRQRPIQSVSQMHVKQWLSVGGRCQIGACETDLQPLNRLAPCHHLSRPGGVVRLRIADCGLWIGSFQRRWYGLARRAVDWLESNWRRCRAP